MSQVEKDEEIKRRVSSAMKAGSVNMECLSVKPTDPSISEHLIKRTSSSSPTTTTLADEQLEKDQKTTPRGRQQTKSPAVVSPNQNRSEARTPPAVFDSRNTSPTTYENGQKNASYEQQETTATPSPKKQESSLPPSPVPVLVIPSLQTRSSSLTPPQQHRQQQDIIRKAQQQQQEVLDAIALENANKHHKHQRSNSLPPSSEYFTTSSIPPSPSWQESYNQIQYPKAKRRSYHSPSSSHISSHGSRRARTPSPSPVSSSIHLPTPDELAREPQPFMPLMPLSSSGDEAKALQYRQQHRGSLPPPASPSRVKQQQRPSLPIIALTASTNSSNNNTKNTNAAVPKPPPSPKRNSLPPNFEIPVTPPRHPRMPGGLGDKKTRVSHASSATAPSLPGAYATSSKHRLGDRKSRQYALTTQQQQQQQQPITLDDQNNNAATTAHHRRQRSLPSQPSSKFLDDSDAAALAAAAAAQIPLPGAYSTPNTPTTHRRLGDRKLRPTPVEAKNRASPPTYTMSSLAPPIRASPTSSNHGNHHRQLGDRKTRVSLPPSASITMDTSLPSQTTNEPHQQHRRDRSSLPEAELRSSALELANDHSLATAAAAGNIRSGSPPRRGLGDKKKRAGDRISSMPTSAALAAAAAQRQTGSVETVSSGSDIEEEKREVDSGDEDIVVPTGPPPVARAEWVNEKAGPAGRMGVPIERREKGLAHKISDGNKQNNASTPANPNGPVPFLPGPGAFFVPGETVMPSVDNDNEEQQQQAQQQEDRQARQATLRQKYDEVYGSLATSAEEIMANRDAATASNNDIPDLEQGPILDATATVAAPHDHSMAFSVQSTRRNLQAFPSRRPRSSAAIHAENDETNKKETTCWHRLVHAPWWCQFGVPLVFAAFVAVMVVVVVEAFNKKSEAAAADSLAPTVSPTPAPTAYVFHNLTLPEFTLAALENPTSPQSRARDWLQKDPNLASYSSKRKIQRLALATLFYSTNGDRWKNSTNWMSYDIHECAWFSARLEQEDVDLMNELDNETDLSAAKALTCDSDLNYQYLLLASDSLRGSLPPEISLLTSLVQVSLEDNILTGSIPSQLGTLTKLVSLGLSQNRLYGTIPTDLANLHTTLKRLYVRQNQLTGPLPALELSALTLLEAGHFTDNMLTGTIGTEIGQWRQLETLRFGGNSFVGSIPTELSRCTKLEILNFGSNQMTGTLPFEFRSLKELTFLGVANNRLQSTIPIEFQRLTNLQTFFATGAGLRGPIPSQLARMTSLVALALGGNRLTGTMPSEIGLLSNLQSMYLFDNRIQGSLPSEIGNLKQLEILHAYLLQIGSTIPSEVGLLDNLQELLLFQTKLSGSIPPQLGNLPKLTQFNVAGTDLVGEIPQESCELQSSGQLEITADCNEVACC